MFGSKKKEKKEFDVMKVLSSIQLLSGLSKDELDKLSQELKKKEFKKGDYLMKEGETGDQFFIIVEGTVEVSTKKGGVLANLEAGDYAGEQALLSQSKEGSKRNASLVCQTQTICLICNQKTFQKVIASHTSVKFAKRDGKRNAFYTAINMDDIKKEMGDKPDNMDEEIKDKKSKYYKTEKIIKSILNNVKNNALWNQYPIASRERLVKRMWLKKVDKNQKLITQGEDGDTFYVVQSGTFNIYVDEAKVGEVHKGGCFGELALINNAPRAATIQCMTSNSSVWVITRNEFRYEIMNQSRAKTKDNIKFLKSVGLFKPLLAKELAVLADSLEEESFADKETIFQKGDEGDKFYIIKSGTLTWQKSKDESGTLKSGQYFGERALRTKEKRAATIITSSKVELLSMSGEHFLDLLGPVLEIIDDGIEKYKKSRAKDDEEKFDQDNKINQANIKKKIEANKADKICDIKKLKTIGVLGKGGFGLVTLVQDPNTKKTYALKAIKKYQVIELELQKHIISEKKVMDMLTNKFLVNLHTTYKDKLRVYFLLDACLGGELFTILRNRRYFNEPTSRFYAGCVVEAFAYMHSLDIIYRDLKPENLVLDNDGYLKVTDFGFAKQLLDGKTFTLCGTPDYLCPEIVTGQGHGKGVDWWTLGILIYEMLASFPPFVADDPIETYRKIIRGRIRFPRYFSQDVRELIKGLLHNKPTRRLGILKGGADNIRKHSWYKHFKWDSLRKGDMLAPIVNKVKSSTDCSNFARVDLDDEDAKPVDPKLDFDDIF